jgi:hypothetical protein
MSCGKRGVLTKWQSKEVFGCEWLYESLKPYLLNYFFKFDIFRQVLKSKMAFGKHIKD